MKDGLKNQYYVNFKVPGFKVRDYKTTLGRAGQVMC